MKRKLKLLRHVIRADDNEDPLRQVAFKAGSVKGARVEKRRTGKPKMDWIWEGKKQVWKKLRHETEQSERRNPGRRRKCKGKWKQDVSIFEGN